MKARDAATEVMVGIGTMEARIRKLEAALRVARGYVVNVVEAEDFEWNRRDLATVDEALLQADQPA